MDKRGQLSRQLLRARDLMDRHYADPLDIGTLAARAHVTESYFIRQYRQRFGETPHRYLVSRRMERAMQLLRDTDRSVTDICLAVGYASLGTFSAQFRRFVGRSPTGYRAQARSDQQARDQLARLPGCVVKIFSRPAI